MLWLTLLATLASSQALSIPPAAVPYSTNASSQALSIPPAAGPYSTNASIYTVETLDSSDPRVWAWAPTNASGPFPLIPFLHGIAGGHLALASYTLFLSQLASYGFVVVATFSCNYGCVDAHQPRNERWLCSGLPPLQPAGMGWGAYYAEAFKIIDWARNGSSSDPFFSLIDHSVGAGIVGHSMGGQGAAMAASKACTEAWGVGAAVLLHPAKGDVPGGNIGSNMSVPVAGFTSSGDPAFPGTLDYMEAFQGTGMPSALRNEVGWSHLEPLLWPPCENPLLATYTAAWLKVHLQKDRGEYYDLIYGTGPDSLCRHAQMVNCSVTGAPEAQLA